jgi:glutamyl-tRNA synthetase
VQEITKRTALASVRAAVLVPNSAPMVAPGYRGRLAPSPTGKLHFGVARTALLAWLRARACNGTLVLRVEDVDRPRVVDGAAEAIMDDLRWLGIDWDEGPDVGGAFGPYVQSARSPHYDRALERLTEGGLAFACSCTRAELMAASSAPHGELGPRYPGTCRQGPKRPRRACSLRFRMDAGEAFVDGLYGAQPAAPGDDFIVHRSDGLYAYQLAVVVDDIAMQISEVVRGADLLSSTPRQLALYRALGASAPAFLHVPLVLGTDGARLAKRHGAVAVADYRARGRAPERVVAALAWTLGLAREGERLLRPPDLLSRFALSALPREPSVLDPNVL